MLNTQDTKEARNLELAGGLERGDGGDYVIRKEERRSRSRRKVVEHIAVDRTKLEACCEKS